MDFVLINVEIFDVAKAKNASEDNAKMFVKLTTFFVKLDKDVFLELVLIFVISIILSRHLNLQIKHCIICIIHFLKSVELKYHANDN